MLSSHSLTRTAAGWLYEKSMHECPSGGLGTLEVYQGAGSTMTSMTPSANILPGTLGSLKRTGVGDLYWIQSRTVHYIGRTAHPFVKGPT